eukprot:46367-Pleurochrysis_carterae.AAC.1
MHVRSAAARRCSVARCRACVPSQKIISSRRRKIPRDDGTQASLSCLVQELGVALASRLKRWNTSAFPQKLSQKLM